MARARGEAPRRGRRPSDRMRPRKYTRINVDSIDYKDLGLLRRFISDKGKTRSRRVTGLSRRWMIHGWFWVLPRPRVAVDLVAPVSRQTSPVPRPAQGSGEAPARHGGRADATN